MECTLDGWKTGEASPVVSHRTESNKTINLNAFEYTHSMCVSNLKLNYRWQMGLDVDLFVR